MHTQKKVRGTLTLLSLTSDLTVFTAEVAIVRMLDIYWRSLEEVLNIGPSLHVSFSSLVFSLVPHFDNEVSWCLPH